MKPLFLFILGAFLYFPAVAQEKEMSEIESLKIAFITKALNLNTGQAQHFWPVYNKYEAKEDNLSKNMHCGIYDKLDVIQSLSDEESEELLENYLELCEVEYKLRKDYVAALQKVISDKQIMILKKAEYDFHRKLLEKYRSGDKK